MSELIVADSWGRPQPAATFRKAAAPTNVGKRMGLWAGREYMLQALQLPGGALLQFDLSRLTLQDFRGMRDHYQVNICEAMLMFLIHQLDWTLKSKNQAQADKIEDNFREHWTPLVRGVGQAYWAGFSPIAVDLENDPLSGLTVISAFKDLLPEECWVNWRREDGYAPPGRQPPRVAVFDGIRQAGLSAPIPVENSLWYPLLMQNGDYYGTKLLRPAFPSWFFSQLIHLFANRYYERFGEPVPVGRADFDDNVDDGSGTGTMIPGNKAMENILSALRNRSVVVLPSDREITGDGKKGEYTYSIEYLESQMRGADFERYMTRLDEEISLALFTPLLVTRTADVGSYNLGVGHLQSYLWMLNALAGDLKLYIDNYVLSRLKDYNFGVRAPKITFEFRSMGKANVEILRTILEMSLRAGDIKPDVTELGAAVGMTFEDISALTVDKQSVWPPGTQKPGQPAPAGAPAPAPGKPAPSNSGSQKRQPRPRANSDPRATGRSVAARLAPQVEKAFNDGRMAKGFAPDFGFRRQMEESLGHEGSNALYENLAAWVDDAAGARWSGPAEFNAAFSLVLESQIDALADDA